jgi:hypothetical protein
MADLNAFCNWKIIIFIHMIYCFSVSSKGKGHPITGHEGATGGVEV